MLRQNFNVTLQIKENDHSTMVLDRKFHKWENSICYKCDTCCMNAFGKFSNVITLGCIQCLGARVQAWVWGSVTTMAGKTGFTFVILFIYVLSEKLNEYIHWQNRYNIICYLHLIWVGLTINWCIKLQILLFSDMP